MRLARKQFFRQEATRQAIERLAEEKRITLVIGAGASAEVGMPLWSELIERLLLRALGPEVPPASDDYPSEILAAARGVLAEKGTMEAATMARAALGDRFEEELRICLYEWQEKWNWDQPGASAHAVARLYELMFENGHSCEVLTTNYDLTLEKAIEDVAGTEVKPMCSDLEDPDGAPVVRHLHGTLTPDGEAHEVALTEADYHKVDAEGIPWQESHLRKRFQDSSVVFVGASLTDEHLLRYIVRYGKTEKPPIAILVRQADEQEPIDVHSEPDQVEELCTGLEAARWELLNLTVLEASFPSQPAQFLYEVANHRGGAWGKPRYGNRLDEWYAEARVDPIGLVSAEKFAKSQVALQAITANWLAALESVVGQEGFDLSEETLEVHLWVRCPDRIGISEEGEEKVELTSLAMLGCSDRIWQDPRAMDVRLITQPSSRAAVDAFCWGTPQIQLPSGRPKWSWILATPVVLPEDSKYGRLPVGAVTLVSDRALEESVLGRIRTDNPKLLVEVERFLSDAAAQLLTS